MHAIDIKLYGVNSNMVIELKKQTVEFIGIWVWKWRIPKFHGQLHGENDGKPMDLGIYKYQTKLYEIISGCRSFPRAWGYPQMIRSRQNWTMPQYQNRWWLQGPLFYETTIFCGFISFNSGTYLDTWGIFKKYPPVN